MVSSVNDQIPGTGAPLASGPLRANFHVIKTEIEDLQSRGGGGNVRTINNPTSTALPQLALGELLQYGSDQFWIGSPSSTNPTSSDSVNYRLMYYGNGQTWVGKYNDIYNASGTSVVYGSSNTIRPGPYGTSYGSQQGNLLVGVSNSLSADQSGPTSYNVIIGHSNRALGATSNERITVVGYNNDLGASYSPPYNQSHYNHDTVVVGSNNDLYYGASSSAYYNVVIGAYNSIRPNATTYGEMYQNIVIGTNIYAQSGSGTPLSNCTLIGNDMYLNRGSGVYYDNIIIGNTSSSPIPSMSRTVGIGRSLGMADGGSWSPSLIEDSVGIGYGAILYNRGGHIGNNQMDTISYGNGTGQSFWPRCDPRLKDGIVDADIDRCLADIERLPIKRFSYKPFMRATRDRTVTGFLSTDYKKVFPKQVVEDRYLAGDEVIEDCESIDPSQLIPTLVAAVQALSAEVKRIHNHTDDAGIAAGRRRVRA